MADGVGDNRFHRVGCGHGMERQMRMSIGEQRFQALVDKAVADALAKLKECGDITLTNSEMKMLEFGVGCGIKAVVEEYIGQGALEQRKTTLDYFAE